MINYKSNLIPLNKYVSILQAGGHLFLELAFPQDAAAGVRPIFKQRCHRSLVESGRAYRRHPARGMWIPTGSKVEGLAVQKGCGQEDFDIDNMYIYGGACGVLVKGYESKGTAEKNINDDSAGENLWEMCKDKNTQILQTPTNSGKQNLKVNTHHPSGHCDDPGVNTPSTSIPRVSSHQRCSACNVISACNVNSDASNYSIAKHVFTDAEPRPSNSGGHERVGSTHDENSHTSSLKSYGTERIGSHAQARNTKHMTKEEMMSRIKIFIAVGGDNSDSESENCDPRELALPPIMYRDRRKICLLIRQESSDSDSDSDSENNPSGEQN